MPRKLKDEIGQTKKFTSPEEEAILSILRTNEMLQIHLVRLFREHGLTEQQYNVLRILRGAGEPLPCLEVADRMVTIVPAITGLMDRLEKRGFVKRERCTRDRRVVYASLTRAGRQLLSVLDQPVDTMHKSLLGHMKRGELRTLITLLEKARAPQAPDGP